MSILFKSLLSRNDHDLKFHDRKFCRDFQSTLDSTGYSVLKSNLGYLLHEQLGDAITRKLRRREKERDRH